MLYDFGSSIRRDIGDSERPLYSLIAAEKGFGKSSVN